MFKQEILDERSHFGSCLITRGPPLEKAGMITTFWRNETSGTGDSISIQLVITPNKELIEAKVTNKTAIVSMKFDASGSLVKDSYLAEYEKMARGYETNFKSFVESLRIKTKPSSSQEAFKPLAANIGKSEVEFSKIVPVQHHTPQTSVSLFIPVEIIREFDLKDGQLVYWKVIGDRLTLKAIKGEHENVTQFFHKTPSRLDAAIPAKIQKQLGITSGISFTSEKITDGEKKFILLKPDKESQDIRAYGKGSMHITVYPTSQIAGDIEEDTIVSWKIHEKGILLEILGSHPHYSRICNMGSSIQVTVPKLILTEFIGSSADFNDMTTKSLQIEMKIKNLKKAEWTTERDQIFLKPILQP